MTYQLTPEEIAHATTVWKRRQNLLYYRYVHSIVAAVGGNARTMLDVGSNGCPYLEQFDWIPQRVSLDRRRPYASERVEGLKRDFFTWQPEGKFDLVICLQVLEHITDATRFMGRLLAVGSHVVISVPYLWPANTSKGHIHDPVDEQKVRSWAGREATHSTIVEETEVRTRSKARRLVAYYDTENLQARLAAPLPLAPGSSAQRPAG